MKIQFDKSGIVRCVAADHIKLTGDILTVADKDLPADFLATFALGKYSVKEGKIARKTGFRKRRQAAELFPPRPKAVKKKIKKKAAKKKVSTKKASTKKSGGQKVVTKKAQRKARSKKIVEP